jgi:hypothetical protein
MNAEEYTPNEETVQLGGAIYEARALGEALINNPNLKAFAAYRRAMTRLANLMGVDNLSVARAVIIQDELDDYYVSKFAATK